MAKSLHQQSMYDENAICNLPVVCKKLSCPQGSSRKGALIGAGADGCSAYARCDNAESKATREKVMMCDSTAVSSRDHYVVVLARQRWLAP